MAGFSNVKHTSLCNSARRYRHYSRFPRWLARQGNRKEFEESLRCLRGKNADISAEAAQIQEGIEKLDKLPKAKRLDLFQRRYLRSLTIGVGLMVFQQFGVINGVSFYASSTLETAGFPADNGTINYVLFQVIFTAVGAALIDRAGRKPLLVISGAGLAIGSLLIGSSFYMKEHGLSPGAAPPLAVSGILVYTLHRGFLSWNGSNSMVEDD